MFLECRARRKDGKTHRSWSIVESRRYSRDRRGNCVQVVATLVVTPEGLPLAYEMLRGNTADKTTLGPDRSPSATSCRSLRSAGMILDLAFAGIRRSFRWNPESESPVPTTIAIMDCRPNCGACCIAPSISSPIPGMPHGKPAGIPCIQLLPDYRCALFGKPERPAVCVSLRPQETMCGANRDQAMDILGALEFATRPETGRSAAGG